MTTEYIDITPSWSSLIDPMIAVLQNGHASYDSQQAVRESLMLLAKAADNADAKCEAKIADYEAAHSGENEEREA
tara:strand:- start:55 stop:279 length:225 start_codon:yes stop_codon:yes gene_type:complete